MSNLKTILVDPLVKPLPLIPLLYSIHLGKEKVKIEWKKTDKPIKMGNAEGTQAVMDALLESFSDSSPFYLDSKWKEFCSEKLGAGIKFSALQEATQIIDSHLKLRMFVGGVLFSLSDIFCWCSLREQAAWMKGIQGGKGFGPDIVRWFKYISMMPVVEEIQETIRVQSASLKIKKKDIASYQISLPDAEVGKVVTRFPPEPSGYLHIGHVKAAMLNRYFASEYKGELIIRFDDTNPSKEKEEYEASILEDLKMLGVHGDRFTYTSDHFDTLHEYCRRLIMAGDAYADNCSKEEMSAQRMDGFASPNRNKTVEESLRIFEEMCSGECREWCIRAKMSIDNPNKAMRDPVIYRCNETVHHRTGTKYRAYPTYDFACPIVDSIEGVTHALRTTEYHDRNDQYYWFIDAFNLRKPHIWDYSRLNFVYTLLSKRKLLWFVEQGLVRGWDDPRFPTVRGILRRGLTAAALKEYILMQGPSKNVLLLEWDKLWSVNKKVIDPSSARYVALIKSDICKLVLFNENESEIVPFTKRIAKHKKNPELGEKETSFSSIAFIEQEDAATLDAGEEITLMDWGNVIVDSIEKHDGVIISIKAKLHLQGDFKTTKKKITWLSPDPNPLISCTLFDYDYLITKKKLEEEDKFEDFVSKQTEFTSEALGDANLKTIKKGEIVQLERKGFYICDKEWSHDAQMVNLIYIPDGKVKSIASKHPSLQ